MQESERSITHLSDRCPMLSGEMPIDDQCLKTYGGVTISACSQPVCSKVFEVILVDTIKSDDIEYIEDNIQGTCPLERADWN
ncbi:hypothetical protein KC946_03000 [Candidatus Saccharibacteria bacterium]|nr:hypothetical protein [Candidatus Saccharibacteria bacterium]